MFWIQARHQASSTDAQSRYATVYEELLVVRGLLGDPKLQQRRRGLRAAISTSLWVGDALKDPQMRVQIVETFMLPNLDAAYEQNWESMGVSRILQHAYAAYRESGDQEKQAKLLRLIIGVATRGSDRDWARVNLAEQMSEQKNFQESIDLLSAIETTDLAGNKVLIPKLQQQLREQSKQQDAKAK
jgi:hypothetical protein